MKTDSQSLTGSGHARELGVVADTLDTKLARLRLPYAEPLTNGDQVMHGGCAASLAAARRAGRDA